MDDGRTVKVEFVPTGNGVTVRETFDAESENPAEQQREGWQAILDSFARHVEAKQKTGVGHDNLNRLARALPFRHPPGQAAFSRR